MSNGDFSVFPVTTQPGSRLDSSGMTYRQHLIAVLAPVFAARLFESDDWYSYHDMACSLIATVDNIIEAEEETA